MNRFTKLSVGKQVLFMFGTLCAVLVAVGALSFLSLRTIERSSRENLSYVANEAQLAEAATQNVGLMQAVIFRHILATDPIEIELLIAPPRARPR
jgi:CHASE3 domain sensor protein